LNTTNTATCVFTVQLMKNKRPVLLRAVLHYLVRTLFAVENLQLQNLLPGFVWKSVTVKPPATTAIGLQQIGKVGLRVWSTPELYDSLQHMRKSLLEHLRILGGTAFERLQNEVSIHFGHHPMNSGYSPVALVID